EPVVRGSVEYPCQRQPPVARRPYAEGMGTNPPDNAGYERRDGSRPDRVIGRARVVPPAGDPEPADPRSAEARSSDVRSPEARSAGPRAYEPRAYQSRAYRGLPYQRPVSGPTPRRLRPRWGRIALVATVLLTLVAGCGA